MNIEQFQENKMTIQKNHCIVKSIFFINWKKLMQKN